MRERTIGILLIAVVALGAVTGVAAADGHVAVEVTDADGDPVVTVTENDTAVENATVTVEPVDENASYAGVGNYTTDENGTVDLPAAESDVNVSVTAETGDGVATTRVLLEAPADEGTDGLAVSVADTDAEPTVTVTDNDTAVENATVTVESVDENASYAGVGNYTTDENGTVGLPAAEENVTVDVTAEYGNETASTTASLTAADEADGAVPFGQLVREFIADFAGDRSDGFGVAIADYVTDNNPGNAPDHAGPGNASDAPGNAPADAGNGNGADDGNGPGNAPEDAGNGAGNDDENGQGPPENAGNGAGNDQGPPADAGNGNGADDDADEDDADDESDDEDADDGNDADADEADSDEADADDSDGDDGGSTPGNGQGNGPPN